MQVEDADQIEGFRFGRIDGKVLNLPGDGETEFVRQNLSLFRSNVRKINRSHFPAFAGKVKGIPSFAGGQVQSPAGRQLSGKLDKYRAGFPGKKQGSAAVFFVPFFFMHVASSPAIVPFLLLVYQLADRRRK
jgi:hypothetical protein